MRKLTALVLALFLLCNMTSALAEEMQEVKVGNVFFQIPAELTGGVYAETNGMAGHDYTCDQYFFTLATMPLEFVENDPQFSFLDLEHLEDDHLTGLYWATQLFAGRAPEDARALVNDTTVVPYGEVEMRVHTNASFSFLAHCYNGTACFIGITGKEGSSLTQNDLLVIAMNILASYSVEPAAAQE